MWKRGRARGEEERIGGQWREGGRVIRGGGEQRERGQGFYDVWEGEVTFPLTFILAFFPPRALLPHTQKHTNTLSFSHTLQYAGSHAPAHLQQCLQSALEQAHTHSHLSICFSTTLCSVFSPVQVPLQPGQSFKFTVLETLDRIKEEFQFLQAQYHRYPKHITQIHLCMRADTQIYLKT